MSNLLVQGLRGLRTLSDLAAKKLEEVDASDLESRVRGQLDLNKVQAVFAQTNAAIDQLQQRVSNLESLVGQLEGRLPPKPPPATLPGRTTDWVKPT